MTTRRAFLAAAFGAALARALPKPKCYALRLVCIHIPTKIAFMEWVAVPTYERNRVDFFNPALFVPYCKNPSKYGSPDPMNAN